jgi:hypothetical protein
VRRARLSARRPLQRIQNLPSAFCFFTFRVYTRCAVRCSAARWCRPALAYACYAARLRGCKRGRRCTRTRHACETLRHRRLTCSAAARVQLRKLGSSGSVTLSDTRADGWHTVVRRGAVAESACGRTHAHARTLAPRQVVRNAPAASPPWAVRRLLRGRKIEYFETKRRRERFRLCSLLRAPCVSACADATRAGASARSAACRWTRTSAACARSPTGAPE